MSALFRKILYFTFFAFFIVKANAQSQKGEFFGYTIAGANFCQIDGDAASGYNKFGMTLGYMVGQGLGENKLGTLTYETGAAYSIRGSRRPFDPDNPGMASFNFVYQMIDIPICLQMYQGKFVYGAGIKTTYLLKAEDKDNYVLNLQRDMRKLNLLGTLNLDYRFADDLRVYLEAQYSMNSIRIANNVTSLYYKTGVYHNVISLGLKWQLNGN